MNVRTVLILCIFTVAVAASAALAQSAADLASLEENAVVSVREGDRWSKATFLKREGRRFQVRYGDGTEEWVSADRLRADGGAGDAGEAKADDAAKAKRPSFAIGATAEAKDNSSWEAVKVINRRGEWYLVEWVGWNGWREWVEPWRMRETGSDYDVEGWHSNGRVRNNAGPPTPQPGPAPEEEGSDAAAKKRDPFAAPETGFPVTEAVRFGDAVLPVADDWQYTASQAAPTLPQRPTVLPPLGDRRAKYEAIRFAGPTVVVTVGGGFGDDKTTGLARVEGNAVTAIQINPASYPLALSPGGELVACRSNGFHSGTSSRVDVYKLAGRTPEHVVSFVPDDGGADVLDASFADGQKLLVLTSGELTCWDFAAATCAWRMQTGRGTGGDTIARSGDGKTIAAGTSQGVALLEAASGKILGVLPTDAAGELSFSTDGKRLLAKTSALLSVWNLADGKLVYQLGLPEGVDGKLLALDADHAMIGDTLFSVAKMAPVWRYPTSSPTAAADGRVWTLLTEGNRTLLVNAALPSAAAAAAEKRMGEAELALRPGMSVSINLQHDAPADQRQAAVAAITRRMEAAGIKVEPNAAVQIVSATAPGESRTAEYRRGGMTGGSTERVTITSKITTLSVQSGGKTLWSTSRTVSNDPGMMVMTQGDKSIQQAADERLKAGGDWIAGVSVPTLIAAPVDVAALHAGKWMIGGVRD